MTSRSWAAEPLSVNRVAAACSVASPASPSNASATASFSEVCEVLVRTTNCVRPA